jgi:hypothetical protein
MLCTCTLKLSLRVLSGSTAAGQQGYVCAPVQGCRQWVAQQELAAAGCRQAACQLGQASEQSLEPNSTVIVY